MKKTWILFLSAMICIIAIVKILTVQGKNEIPETEATIYSETAKSGSISSVLPGTGTLNDEDSVALVIPSEVEVTKWCVKSGDHVLAGDQLAEVDRVSVMSAIVSVQEKMALLDEELQLHENDEIADEIEASADGRIKMIYGEPGESVAEIMYEYGTLMRISLDGLMAVSLETEQKVSIGEKVILILSDEAEAEGKVESVADGMTVVTASDKNIDFDESVTVVTEDGITIGTGNAYIHSELKVTGYTGTLDSIAVSKEEVVSKGDTLVVLSDTDYTGEYETLLSKRRELDSYMQMLFQMYQDQCVYASCDGIISGLEAVTEQTQKTAEAQNTAETLSVGGDTGGAMMTLSYSEGTASQGIIRTIEDRPAEVANGSMGDGIQEESPDGDMEEGTAGEVPDSSTEGSTPDSGAEGSNPDSAIDGESSDVGMEEVYTNYIGTVSAVTQEGTRIMIQLAGAGQGENSVLSISESTRITVFSNGNYQIGTAGQIRTGQMLMAVYESTHAEAPIFCIVIASSWGTEENSPENSDKTQESMTKENISGMDQNGTESDVKSSQLMQELQEEIEQDYGVEKTTWLSIVPQDKMTITITVDEMDVLSLQVGQEAEVTIHALKGQSFMGEVTAVNLNGTNSGGSSKYEAVISFARKENMLSGMNASVQIILDTKDDILIIPEAALEETESGIYVYTSYNEKTDTLEDPVEVTTGLSDGENVEILSGLEKGSAYWYRYLDVVNR